MQITKTENKIKITEQVTQESEFTIEEIDAQIAILESSLEKWRSVKSQVDKL